MVEGAAESDSCLQMSQCGWTARLRVLSQPLLPNRAPNVTKRSPVRHTVGLAAVEDPPPGQTMTRGCSRRSMV
jgi:hypothetical protein